MPFDAPKSPARPRAVGLWLAAVAAMVFVMVVLGGATRLTGSGLSIMEWAPVSGALPPLSDAEWQRLYALYRQIPQYALVNEGFGLAGFKQIFWLEYVHRLWGRLLGVVFILPLAWFAWRRALPAGMAWRLALLAVIGGLQGAVGWFMVASGFAPDSVAVAPVRLVLHLALALALYGALVWIALGLLRPPAPPAPLAVRALAWVATGLACLAIVAGGFVAGLKAGLDYNTFPLMDGRLVPEGYASLRPWGLNLIANIAAVQFDHRLAATLATLAAAALVLRGWAVPDLRGVLAALAALVAMQYALGVVTLLHAVPVPLAVAHQAGAVLVLTALLAVLHVARGAARPHLDPIIQGIRP